MHVTFERGAANRFKPTDVRFYSAKKPDFYEISRQEQALEILRNVTTNPADRVKAFSFKASGGAYAKLFDGTEQVLSWDTDEEEAFEILARSAQPDHDLLQEALNAAYSS